MKNKCPCKGCLPPRRSPACHTTCTHYAEWKAERDKKNAQVREAKKTEEICLFFTRRGTSGDF